MDGDHLHAEVFRDMRQFGGVEIGMVPAHPHLDGHGHIDRLDRRFHQLRRQRHFAHQRRPGQLTHDLAHRTAEIDVDDSRAVVLLQLGRLGHAVGIAADQLHRHRFLDRVPSRLLDALPRFADRRFAGDHLGHIEARAIAPHQAPERQVGHAGHRREHHRRVDRHVADLDRLRGCGRERLRRHMEFIA